MTEPPAPSRSRTKRPSNDDFRTEANELLADRRLELGLTQVELARKAGLTADTIHHLETWAVRPTARSTRAVLEALGIHPDEWHAALAKTPERKSGYQTKRVSRVVVAVWPSSKEITQVCEEIDAALAERQMSRVGLATEIGISRSALGKYMSGNHPFPVSRLAQIEAFLELPKQSLTSLASADDKCEFDRFLITFETLRLRRCETLDEVAPSLGRNRINRLIVKQVAPSIDECDTLDEHFEVSPGTFLALARDRHAAFLGRWHKPRDVQGRAILGFLILNLMSPRELADRLGVSPSSVGNWIVGKYKPNDVARLQFERLAGPMPSEDFELMPPGGFYEVHRRMPKVANANERRTLVATLKQFAQMSKPRHTWSSRQSFTDYANLLGVSPRDVTDDSVARILDAFDINPQEVGQVLPSVLRVVASQSQDVSMAVMEIPRQDQEILASVGLRYANVEEICRDVAGWNQRAYWREMAKPAGLDL